MPLVRRIRKRGANIVVEANAEVLFAPSGDVGRWTNRFSQRVGAFTRAEAPSNKRPRWSHYGKPLASTITASTTYQPGRMRVYAAIGSGAPHAYYVDQGTGVYAGNSPYEAKVLPPWAQGSPSLYERTWRPGGPGTRRVAPVMIKGQKGQNFFDKGLRRGFQSMRMRSFQVPGDGRIGNVLDAIPTGMLNFKGNTPADGAFRSNLEQWRSWRDAAYQKGDALGRDGGRRPKPSKAPKPPKASVPSAPPKPTKPSPNGYPTVAAKKAAAVARFIEQNPNIKIMQRTSAGLIVKTSSGPYLLPWSRLYALLP